MNKNEIIAALSAKGIAFDASASKADLERLLSGASVEFVIDDDLLKVITDNGGLAFDSDELKAQLKAEKEREYPDTGKDIPTGVYHLTGYSTIIDWRNPKTDAVSHIRVAYLDKVNPNNNLPYMLPFAALSCGAYKFKPIEGDAFQPKCALPHYDSIADRNLAVVGLGAGTEIKVCHERGHHENPYNKRVFDFTYTWGELA